MDAKSGCRYLGSLKEILSYLLSARTLHFLRARVERLTALNTTLAVSVQICVQPRRTFRPNLAQDIRERRAHRRS